MLGHADFGPQDNFLKVGGHSLGVAGLAEKLSVQFNIHVAVRDIYEHLVFEDLAATLYRRTQSLHGEKGPERVHAFEADAIEESQAYLTDWRDRVCRYSSLAPTIGHLNRPYSLPDSL